MKEESLEVKIARIDVNVQHLKESLPKITARVNQHDKELLVAKVLLVVIAILGAAKYPSIAEAIKEWVKV